MESVKVKEFLSTNNSSGFGSGFDSDFDSTFGSGSGSASGSASGYADCSTSSSYGHGYASGLGYGDGSMFGLTCDIKSYINKPVFCIDDTPTIIRSIRGNVAKGLILKSDLITTPCFVVKVGNCFAHGKTIKEAFLVAQAKHFNEMPEDERLQAFVDAHEWGLEYPDKDFYDWHNKLTGSCAMGRDMFAKEHGLEKLDGKHTVEWFVELTKDAYGGEIIKRIPSLYLHK